MPKENNGSERQTKNDSYERQAKKNDSEHHKREDMVTLNAKLKKDGVIERQK